MILTRYLYDKDEVELSFITALLSDTSLDECLYWIFEYHYSGYDTIQLLWKVYSDFYAIYYPKLESWIKTRQDLFIQPDSKQINIIGDIVRNLYKKSFSSHVFLMRQYCQYLSNHKCSFPKNRGRKYKWLTNYDAKYHTLLSFIHKKHYEGICHALLSMTLDDELYYTLIDYFRTIQNIEFINETRIKRKWESKKKYYSDMQHNFLTLIVYLLEDERNINQKNMFILANQSHIDQVLKTNSPLPLNPKYNTMQNYYTLDHRRLYSIHDTIGSFRLSRFEFPNHETYVREIWLHWEYYVWYSSLWRERLKGNTVDHESRKILFTNDDIMEQFYQQYGYELDERPKRIQDMSLKELNNASWKAWYDSVLSRAKNVFPDIPFPKDFQFYI